jgi:hypothetical protein
LKATAMIFSNEVCSTFTAMSSRTLLSFLIYIIVTYRPTARQQLSMHGSGEHAKMGAVFSVDECYSSLLGSTKIMETEGVFYVVRATSI